MEDHRFHHARDDSYFFKEKEVEADFNIQITKIVPFEPDNDIKPVLQKSKTKEGRIKLAVQNNYFNVTDDIKRRETVQFGDKKIAGGGAFGEYFTHGLDNNPPNQNPLHHSSESPLPETESYHTSNFQIPKPSPESSKRAKSLGRDVNKRFKSKILSLFD
jgi:hypothetical protein